MVKSLKFYGLAERSSNVLNGMVRSWRYPSETEEENVMAKLLRICIK